MKIPTTRKYKGAVELVRTLREAGHEAFLVGGCVRDLLLGRTATDYDIATSAKPQQIQALFPRTVPVGVQFGVILVLQGRTPYEVATFRTDLGYADGRHPEGVRFSTARQDALRRDFTVNGLFFDPVKREVIDHVKGQIDLERKVIRAIGSPYRRFEEDKLRVLRAVRFTANLGFEIDPKTWAAVRKMAGQIRQVSQERIRDELVKLFTDSHPERGLELLDTSGLLKILLPEVDRTKGVQQPPEYHPEGDVFTHTVLILKQLKNPSPVLAISALLHDIGKPPTFKVAERIRFDGHDRVGAVMAEKICRRLRFSRNQTEAISEVIGDHMRFKDVRQMRMATLKRFMGLTTFPEQLKMHRADCMASHKDLGNWHFLREKLKEFSTEEIKPKPLITGRDLLSAGYPAGPRMGTILRAVQDQQLEKQLISREAAMDWVAQNFPVR